MTFRDLVNSSVTDRDNRLIYQIDSSPDLSSLRFLVCDNPNLFQRYRIAKTFAKKIKSMQVKIDGRVISSLVTHLSKLNVPTSTSTIFDETMDDLAKIATPGLPQFRSRDISFTLHALSKKLIRNKTIFETAGKVMLSRFQDFYPKDISMILCAFSRLGYTDMKFFDPLADLIVPELDSYASPDLSGIIYSFSTFQDARKDVLIDAATTAIGTSSTFNSRDMARLLRSLSMAGCWDEQLGKIMAEQAISIMGTFNGADVSLLASAYAQQGQSHPELFHAISKRVIQIVETLNADDLLQIFQSFARSNQGHHAFYDELASAAILIMDTFTVKHFNGVLHACCMLRYLNAHLFNEIAESSMLKMESFGPRALRLLSRSFSKLRYYHPNLMTELGRQLAHDENRKFHVETLIHVMDGLANLNLKPSTLDQLRVKCENVIPILDTAEDLDMVKSLFCLQMEGNCIERIEEKISKKCNSMANEDIIAVAKTFTIVRYKKTEFWMMLGKEILRREDAKWTAKDLGIVSSAFGSMTLSFCAKVVSMCFKQFQLKDSSKVTIQDAAAISSAIPFGHRAKILPEGFIDHMLELAMAKAHEARYDDVRCVLINFSQIDLPVTSRRKFLGTYRHIFYEVSWFLKPEDCEKISALYKEMDQIRDDSTWANNFSFCMH